MDGLQVSRALAPQRPRDNHYPSVRRSSRPSLFSPTCTNSFIEMKLYLIFIAIIFTTAAACGSGESSCNGACYKSGQYSCVTDVSGGLMLCPVNFQACNGACYSSSVYHCSNGKLVYGAASSTTSSGSSTSSGGTQGVNAGPVPAASKSTTSTTKAATSTTKAATTTTKTPTTTSSSASACAYSNEQKWSGSNFFNQFDFFTAADPTNGFVKFVDQTTAENDGLISVSGDQVYMGVDHTNVQASGRSA
ncbi:endo-1,3(4)-beta-glucanase, partial [Planoprotostelium fungivorum]